MNLNDFLDLTPRQFFNAVGGFIDKEEMKIREDWEQTRLIITSIESKEVYGYKISKKDPKRLLPLPWDNGGAPTEDEIEQLRKDTWPQEQ